MSNICLSILLTTSRTPSIQCQMITLDIPWKRMKMARTSLQICKTAPSRESSRSRVRIGRRARGCRSCFDMVFKWTDTVLLEAVLERRQHEHNLSVYRLAYALGCWTNAIRSWVGSIAKSLQRRPIFSRMTTLLAACLVGR